MDIYICIYIHIYIYTHIYIFLSFSANLEAKINISILLAVIFFLNFFYLFTYLFLAVLGPRFLCEGFLQLRQAGATLHRGARASHRRGPSCCGAQAPDAQAQQLWLTGSVAPRHVGSSRTRARTRIPCTGRQTLNHCATMEAHHKFLSYIIR